MAVSRCKSCSIQQINQLLCTNSLHDILCKIVHCPRNFHHVILLLIEVVHSKNGICFFFLAVQQSQIGRYIDAVSYVIWLTVSLVQGDCSMSVVVQMASPHRGGVITLSGWGIGLQEGSPHSQQQQ